MRVPVREELTPSVSTGLGAQHLKNVNTGTVHGKVIQPGAQTVMWSVLHVR